MEELGLLDPKLGYPQTNAQDLMAYREVFDLDYAMPIQREGAIMHRFPGEFVPAANAHALEETCRPVVEEMIRQGGAKAIAVASSYSDGGREERVSPVVARYGPQKINRCDTSRPERHPPCPHASATLKRRRSSTVHKSCN
jgi:hypothetical protein